MPWTMQSGGSCRVSEQLAAPAAARTAVQRLDAPCRAYKSWQMLPIHLMTLVTVHLTADNGRACCGSDREAIGDTAC